MMSTWQNSCTTSTVDREIFAVKIFASVRGATKIKGVKN